MSVFRLRPLWNAFSSLSLVGAALLAAGAWAAESETSAEVTLVQLRSGTLPLTIRALARIGATRQTPARISARTAGIVTEIVARDGADVHPGDVLLRLDSRVAESNVRKTKSDVGVADRELAYAEKSGLDAQQSELDIAARQARAKAGQDARESERLAALLEKNLVSGKAATDARQLADTAAREAGAAETRAKNFREAGRTLELERLRARLEDARAAARLAELDAEGMIVKAPMEARVTRVPVAVGQSVDAGAVLVEIEAHGGAGVRFALTPEKARQVKLAAGFSLHETAGAQGWRGKIVSVGAGVDEETGLVRVEGVLDATDAPPPFMGQSLHGEVVVGQSAPGFIVPESALSVSNEGASVHIVDAENVAHLVPVAVLTRTGGEAAVTGDKLAAGASVIADGNYNLPDGAHVRPGK